MTIKLLQWNILCDEDPRKIAALIKEIDPDIACLQELTKGYNQTLDDVGAAIARQTGLNGIYYYGPMAMPNGTSSQMGNGIFTKLPILDQKKTILQVGQTSNGRVTQDERSYVEATVGNLTIATTHLPFRPTMRTTKSKRLLVDRLTSQAQAAKRPYVLTGDFNSTPTSAIINQMKASLKLVGPAMSQPTWTTKPWTIGGISFDRLDWRFDYIFTSPEVKQLAAKIITTEVSDHLPIVCQLEV